MSEGKLVLTTGTLVIVVAEQMPERVSIVDRVAPRSSRTHALLPPRTD